MAPKRDLVLASLVLLTGFGCKSSAPGTSTLRSDAAPVVAPPQAAAVTFEPQARMCDDSSPCDSLAALGPVDPRHQDALALDAVVKIFKLDAGAFAEIGESAKVEFLVDGEVGYTLAGTVKLTVDAKVARPIEKGSDQEAAKAALKDLALDTQLRPGDKAYLGMTLSFEGRASLNGKAGVSIVVAGANLNGKVGVVGAVGVGAGIERDVLKEARLVDFIAANIDVVKDAAKDSAKDWVRRNAELITRALGEEEARILREAEYNARRAQEQAERLVAESAKNSKDGAAAGDQIFNDRSGFNASVSPCKYYSDTSTCSLSGEAQADCHRLNPSDDFRAACEARIAQHCGGRSRLRC